MEDALSLIEETADLMDSIIEDGPLEKEASTSTEIAYVFGLCVLAFFGTVGNIFILIMFCREELSQTSYSIYIRAAAITDTVFMLQNISEDIIDYATSYKPERFEGTSFGLCVFSVVIHKTTLTSSLWIVVALAVDRCVAIWKPLHRTVYCTRKIAVILTAVILLLSLSLELGVALTFSSIVLDDDLKPVCQSFSSDRIIIMDKRLSTETGLPCLAMLLPNLLVIRKIQQSLSFRRRFSTAADLQKKQVAKSARPLLVVSCLAFLTLLPVSITELVEFIKIMNEDMHNQDHFNRNKSVDETFRGRDFDFSNGTLENITRRQFFEEIDQGFRTNMVESIIDDMESRHGIEDMKPENDQEVLNEEGEGDYEEGEGDYEEGEGDYEEGDYEEGDYEEEEGDYEEGKDDYEEGEGDYEEGEGDYEEGDYEEGGDDYEEGEEDYEEGEGDYEEGEGDYEEGEGDYEEGEGDFKEWEIVLNSIWKTSNFIYMCNFAQNFYLLILNSKTYRGTILQIFSPRAKRSTRTVQNSVQRKRSVVHTISQPTVNTASLKGVSVSQE